MFSIIVNTVATYREYKGAVRALQLNPAYAGQFDDLNLSTVRNWFDDAYTLKDHVRRRWQERKPRSWGSGRPYLLATAPAAEKFIIDTLHSLRNSGSTINSVVISALMKSVLSVHAPSLLDQLSISRRWCRYWLKRKIGWTFKKATTSGQKLPLDWQQQVSNMRMRVAATAMTYNITHPCFIVNWDQSGLMLLSTHKYTYHNKKDKQVPMIGLDEKRQITIVVAGCLSGELLPLQLIFTGQDVKKAQQKAVPTLDPITNTAVQQANWHLTQTHNHWSTQDSMRDYVRYIIHPWIEKKRAEHGCPNSHAILLFDCWSVHKSDEFLTWLSTTFPHYHPIFIPAGCTGKAQPADLVMQRPLKIGVSNEYTHWMNSEIIALLQAGATPDQVRVDVGMAKVKPLLVKWVMHSWLSLGSRIELLKKGWLKAGLGDVLESKVQLEATKLVMSKQLTLENDKQQEEAEGISESDVAQLQADMDMCDDNEDSYVEDDEEEMDVDVCLAACLEEKPFTGIRRSARISSQADSRASVRVAQLIQEQTEQEACIIFDE